jgi:hypothetical protein
MAPEDTRLASGDEASLFFVVVLVIGWPLSPVFLIRYSILRTKPWNRFLQLPPQHFVCCLHHCPPFCLLPAPLPSAVVFGIWQARIRRIGIEFPGSRSGQLAHETREKHRGAPEGPHAIV